MKEKQDKERELEELRKKQRELKKKREFFIEKQCKKYNVKVQTILTITGYNQIEEYTYQDN